LRKWEAGREKETWVNTDCGEIRGVWGGEDGNESERGDNESCTRRMFCDPVELLVSRLCLMSSRASDLGSDVISDLACYLLPFGV